MGVNLTECISEVEARKFNIPESCNNIMYNDMVIVCAHVLNGQPIYTENKAGDILCENCFKHYNSYGRDKNGCWKIPKDEDLSNLKTVCKTHAMQIKSHRMKK